MPTTQVEPTSEAFLQEIANSLWKSRKVVVITGAGISTNSGIPDFRSEHGLYSLIQAQFDAAAAGEAGSSNNDDPDESDLSSETGSERSPKRRRLSRDRAQLGGSRNSQVNSITVTHAQEEPMAEIRWGEEPDASGIVVSPDMLPHTELDASGASLQIDEAKDTIFTGLETRKDVCMPGGELQYAPGPGAQPPPDPTTPNRTPACSVGDLANPFPIPSPFVPRGQIAGHIGSRDEQSVHFPSSPPSLTHDNLRFPSDSEQTYNLTVTSSPLSSPPPVLYDPYQQSSRQTSQSSSSPSSQSSASSDAESEIDGPSSSSTPPLTSQSSFTSMSARNTLPNLKGKDLFDAQIWSCPTKTSVFYTFISSLRQKARDAEPTTSHQFVGTLRDSRKLVRCYTQNIDQLEERVGLSTSLELGAGSRYRFSARAPRTSGGARSLLKEQESSSQSPAGSGEKHGRPVENNGQSESRTESVGSQQSNTASDETQIGDIDSKAPPSSAPPCSQSTESDGPATKPPPNRGVECICLHGSLAQLRCFVCGRTSSWDDESRLSDTLAGRQPTCPHCAGATAAREERGKRALGVGKLRPDIVLYGEEHPHSHLISPIIQHDLSLGPDMLLILGTSMRVHGLKVLVREFAKAVHDRGGKVIFVNFTKPPESVWSDIIDFWVQWDCDAWVGDLQKRKPALWLPPGTALPDEDKPKKAAKVSRKGLTGEPSKRRNDAAGPKSRREVGGAVKKPTSRLKKEASSITVSTPKEEAEIIVLEITAAGDPSTEPTSSGEESTTNPPVEIATPTALTTRPVVEAALVADRHTTRSILENAPDSNPTVATEIAVGGPESTDVAPIHPPEAMAPPPLPEVALKMNQRSIKELKPKESRVRQLTTKEPKAREPKFNPDAKRPVSVRDHKLNGAFLTWKIAQDLRRLTGREPIEPPVPSPTLPKEKPKVKKARKSAPAALITTDVPICSDGPATEDADKSNAEIRAPTHEPVMDIHFPQTTEPESSISALVKSRKRKRQSWKMVRGIETLVDLDSQDEKEPEAVRPTPAAPVKPKNTPKARLSLPLPVPSRIPDPSPGTQPLRQLALQDGFSQTDSLIARLNNDLGFQGLELRKDASGFDETDRLIGEFSGRGGIGGFSETDRLIARYHELASRPATPIHLAPLRHHDGPAPETGHQPPSQKTAPPKLQPLEPKVTSPGPMAGIAPSVGSPPAPTPTARNFPVFNNAPRNPFFFADPLSSHLNYPPVWLDHPYEKSHFQVRSPVDGESSPAATGLGPHSPPELGPEEQLRREQEAAMMLSMMGGAANRAIQGPAIFEGSDHGPFHGRH